MSADELYRYFISLPEMPQKFEVDAETYGIIAQHLINYYIDHYRYEELGQYGNRQIYSPDIVVGPNKGLLFKNVELILKT